MDSDVTNILENSLTYPNIFLVPLYLTLSEMNELCNLIIFTRYSGIKLFMTVDVCNC